MKFADINKKFTEVVTEYMSKGYIINTASMSGSQGEVAKVDLTDGKEIIRIRLANFHEWGKDIEGYEIVIGRYVENEVKPNSNSTWGTIWDNRLEVIESIRFYKLGRYDEDFYGTEEEAENAAELRFARYKARHISYQTEDITDKAMAIAKKIIRREFGAKRISESDIKVTRKDGKYTISYKNKYYRLH